MANYKKGFNLRHGVQVDDDNFIVNANGLVGVGTSVPTQNLDVVGNIRATGLSTTRLLYAGIGTIENLRSSGAVVSGGVTATTFYGSAAGLTGIYAIAVDGWYVGNGVIGTSSLVGAGKTNPTSALDVNGDVLVSGIGTFRDLNVTGVVTAITFSGNATNATRSGLATDLEINATNRLLYQVNNNNTDVLPAGTSGQVLRSNGASAPSWVNPSALDVATAGYASVAGIATYAETAGIATSVLNGIGYLTQLQVTGISTFGNGTISGAPSDIVVAIAGINSSAYVGGRVGIKSTNPQYELDVIGTVKATTFIGDGSQLSNIPPGTFTSCNTNNITSSSLTSHPNIILAENNFFAGVGAGCSIIFGCNNNFFGFYSGKKTTNGNNNNFFGCLAGCSNTTGSHNNFLGRYAGCSNTTGSNNNFSGCQAGFANITGNHNNFFGPYAGYCNTTGCNNNFLGNRAGFANTTGSCNNFLGSDAGRYNTRGCFNNFLSVSAGYGNTTGCYNNFIGNSSGYYNTIGSFNNFIGNGVGFCNISGSRNIFLGSYSGLSTSSSNKIVIGFSTLSSQLFDSPSTNKDTQLAIGLRNRNVFIEEISNRSGTIAGITTNTITGITTTSIYVGQEVRCDTPGVLPPNTFVFKILPGIVELTQISLSIAGITTTFDFGYIDYPSDYWLVGDENFNIGIGTTNPTAKLDVGGNVRISGVATVGLGSTSSPTVNSTMSFELTNNTTLTVRVRGTDGTVRTGTITLS